MSKYVKFSCERVTAEIPSFRGLAELNVYRRKLLDLGLIGVDPNGIVAFTFTERAADELKERIALRVEARLGSAAPATPGRPLRRAIRSRRR